MAAAVRRRWPRLAVLLATVLLSGLGIDAAAVGIVEPQYDDQPGTLLLNMLIKNEAYHLDRSLPKWAPIIDYWIIGIDDKNTDNSEEIIKKHIGHIPGQTVSPPPHLRRKSSAPSQAGCSCAMSVRPSLSCCRALVYVHARMARAAWSEWE